MFPFYRSILTLSQLQLSQSSTHNNDSALLEKQLEKIMSINRNGTRYITDIKKKTVFDSITGVVYAVIIVFLGNVNSAKGMNYDKLIILYMVYYFKF